jgi:hypothetical protein
VRWWRQNTGGGDVVGNIYTINRYGLDARRWRQGCCGAVSIAGTPYVSNRRGSDTRKWRRGTAVGNGGAADVALIMGGIVLFDRRIIDGDGEVFLYELSGRW